MGQQVANRVIKLLIKRGHRIQGATVHVLGITFKENCPDIRNSRAIDVIRELQDFGCDVRVSDPWANPEDVQHEYGLDLIPLSDLESGTVDAIILAVSHDEFKPLDYQSHKDRGTILFDIKSILPKALVDGRL